MKRVGRSFIDIFAEHPVAANTLMAMMLLAGVWALIKLNTQFFPDYEIPYITVQVVWPGASAEDVERAITNPLEQELRHVDKIKEMTSNSKTGSSYIQIEFEQNTDMGYAQDQVKEKVSLVRDLPENSEKPIITRVETYDPVAKLIITGPSNLQQLRPLVYRIERELLDRGIAKITITGLPKQQVDIQIPAVRLAETQLSLEQIAGKIRQHSRDIPAGRFARQDVVRQLRSLDQKRDLRGFAELPIVSDASGQRLTLQDIGKIELRSREQQPAVWYKGKPAVELHLQRASDANSLRSAKILREWMKTRRPLLGDQIQINVYSETWQLIKERIDLLLHNGAGGLLLILIVLFIFLNTRVAWWVAMGIPVSMMAAMAVLYALGGSINMISLFAFIMSLGIIVDDTIVVGEETLTQYQAGETALVAAQRAAHTMFVPIVASSLTTVCAFLPMLLVGDIIGSIIFTIPLVVICVIIASLVECFLVLPGHLHHSFRGKKSKPEPTWRQAINNAFVHFRENKFRKLVMVAIKYRWTTIASAFGLLLLSLGLVVGSHVPFRFFPSPEGYTIKASVRFTSSTPATTVNKFLRHLEQTAEETDAALRGDGVLVKHITRYEKRGAFEEGQGDAFGSLSLELTSPDARELRNDEFIEAWRKRLVIPPGVEQLTIRPPRTGPPGQDLDIELYDASPEILKAAAVELAQALLRFPGVRNVGDDLPFGQEQWVYTLNTVGKGLGLTPQDIGRQVRAAFTGALAQLYYDRYDEIEVRVMLPDSERNNVSAIEHFPIVTPQGDVVPLGTVVDISVSRGPDAIRHSDTAPAIHVTGSLMPGHGTSQQILDALQNNELPALQSRYGVQYRFSGRAKEQAQTFGDMRKGLVLGLGLIYLILAWIFASYIWPLVVMAAIPLGVTGAIIGHWIMGLDLTILSVFGLFGLSGIVVNDSIILLSRYKRLRERYSDVHHAIVEACCQRLRAVLLTSITTIAGLAPLLFERSLQAQFLLPMVTSLAFGLAFATLWILLVIPSLLSIYEDWRIAS